MSRLQPPDTDELTEAPVSVEHAREGEAPSEPALHREDEAPSEPSVRPPCPAPADVRAEVARYDAEAEVGRWDGPRYRMTYRILGHGPPLFLIPGIASTYRTYAHLLNRLTAHFRTIVYDYPGEHPGDGARLSQITHDNLVDDLFGLIDRLNVGRAFLVGISFGSTIALKALHREPRRFPRAVLQGGFAHRTFTMAERWALRLGRLVPGTVSRLPLRRTILTYNSRTEFPVLLDDRWDYYLQENGLTPIRSLAHRVDSLTTLDLGPILSAIPTEILLIQGNEDRIVPRRDFEVLKAALPKAEAAILPTVGHQPHMTHAEVMAQLIHQWLLPCAEGPGGCTAQGGAG
jgi:pimeloyl-ACP methyl ester carboxylesterase